MITDPMPDATTTPWSDEIKVWIGYLRVMAKHGEVTLLPQIAERIAYLLEQAQPPEPTPSTDPSVTMIYRLQCLAALAINRLTGVTLFGPIYTGEQLRQHAIEQSLISFDTLHHTPQCPANHYHRTRLPTGSCHCGALAASRKAIFGHDHPPTQNELMNYKRQLQKEFWQVQTDAVLRHTIKIESLDLPPRS